MELRLIILSVACFSCLVPPVFGTGLVAAKLAAAAGIAKGAALLGAKALAAKGIGALALKGIGTLAAKGIAAKTSALRDVVRAKGELLKEVVKVGGEVASAAVPLFTKPFVIKKPYPYPLIINKPASPPKVPLILNIGNTQSESNADLNNLLCLLIASQAQNAAQSSLYGSLVNAAQYQSQQSSSSSAWNSQSSWSSVQGLQDAAKPPIPSIPAASLWALLSAAQNAAVLNQLLAAIQAAQNATIANANGSSANRPVLTDAQNAALENAINGIPGSSDPFSSSNLESSSSQYGDASVNKPTSSQSTPIIYPGQTPSLLGSVGTTVDGLLTSVLGTPGVVQPVVSGTPSLLGSVGNTVDGLLTSVVGTPSIVKPIVSETPSLLGSVGNTVDGLLTSVIGTPGIVKPIVTDVPVLTPMVNNVVLPPKPPAAGVLNIASPIVYQNPSLLGSVANTVDNLLNSVVGEPVIVSQPKVYVSQPVVYDYIVKK